MWDLPGPGIKLVSPVLAGGFLTIEPPGKPSTEFLIATTSLYHFMNFSFCSKLNFYHCILNAVIFEISSE